MQKSFLKIYKLTFYFYTRARVLAIFEFNTLSESFGLPDQLRRNQ